MSLGPIPDYGDLFTIEEFMEMARGLGFIDWDGTGYFATKDGLSDIVARPSTLLQGFPMKHTGEFTHIMWFNK